MIHGRHREEVLLQIETLKRSCELQDSRYAVLFSKRRFKQCGAHYPLAPRTTVTHPALAHAAHG